MAALPQQAEPARRVVPPTLALRPISAAEFAPFGALVPGPVDATRIDCSEPLANLRAGAAPHLYTTLVPVSALPLTLRQMERHAFSSQTFMPLDVGRYLVAVAPAAGPAMPDVDRLVAFVVPAGLGITYRAGTWHHPMTALDRPGRFAVLMWRDGGPHDEEFVDISPRKLVAQG